MAEAFRRFRLVRKSRESEVITSFSFVPVDGDALWPARPGQYLTLRIPAEGPPKGYVLRTYSLSNSAEVKDCHRISVKREAGNGGHPDGIGSCYLHDILAEGEEIDIAAPRGDFFLDEDASRPVLLLAGGVGVTPLLSMLYRLATTPRRVWLIHATENGAVQALHQEAAALAAGSDGRITVCTVMRAPTEADRAAGRFDAEGLVDRTLLQRLLPVDDYQVYLCGPTPFMVAMWQVLTSLGFAPERIAYEFFGKGGSLSALAEPASPAKPRIPIHAPQSISKLDFLTDPEVFALPETRSRKGQATITAELGSGDEVVFARSGVTVAWSGAGSILELAEAAGLDPAFVCRSGVCNSCICDLKEGTVDYTSEPLDPPAAGKALICCSRPKGRVVLDL